MGGTCASEHDEDNHDFVSAAKEEHYELKSNLKYLITYHASSQTKAKINSNKEITMSDLLGSWDIISSGKVVDEVTVSKDSICTFANGGILDITLYCDNLVVFKEKGNNNSEELQMTVGGFNNILFFQPINEKGYFKWKRKELKKEHEI